MLRSLLLIFLYVVVDLFEFSIEDPPTSFPIIYYVGCVAVCALVVTIVQCIFFGLPEYGKRVDRKEWIRKIRKINRTLQFIEISLLSTPLEMYSPLASALIDRNYHGINPIAYKPDATRLRWILIGLVECRDSLTEMTKEEGHIDSIEDRSFRNGVQQWLQDSTTVMHRLIDSYNFVSDDYYLERW